MLSVGLFAQLRENSTGLGQASFFFTGYLPRVKNCDDFSTGLKMFEIKEYFFQLIRRVLLVHRDPIFCIDE